MVHPPYIPGCTPELAAPAFKSWTEADFKQYVNDAALQAGLADAAATNAENAAVVAAASSVTAVQAADSASDDAATVSTAASAANASQGLALQSELAAAESAAAAQAVGALADSQIAAQINTPGSDTDEALKGAIFAEVVDRPVLVSHGSNAATPRPDTAVVFWYGSVVPLNRLPVDIVRVDTVDAGVWTPDQLPSTKIAIWDARYLAVNEGTRPAEIPDRSGNGHSLLQATEANRPTYRSVGINGLPALSFDGTDDYLATTAFPTPIGGAITTFTVFQAASVTPRLEVITSGAGGATPTRLDLEKSAVGSGFHRLRRSVALDSSVATDNLPHIAESVYNGASSSLTLNGTLIASGTTALTGNVFDRLFWGCRADIAQHYGGLLGYQAVLGGPLSSADTTLMRAFLIREWGF